MIHAECCDVDEDNGVFMNSQGVVACCGSRGDRQMRDSQHTAFPMKGDGFQSTPWTLILAAKRAARLAAQSKRSGETHFRMVIHHMAHELAQNLSRNLAQAYWKPVYCFLYRTYPKDAEDLTQSFFCHKLLDSDLPQQAEPGRGRFRSYLLGALRNFVKDVYKSPRDPLKRGYVTIDFEDADKLVPSDIETPEEAFHYQLVRDLVDKVLAEVRTELIRDHKEIYWEIFDAMVLNPIMAEHKKPAREQLAGRYGLKDSQTVSNMKVTVERRFRNRLMTRLQELICSESDVSGEYQEILRFLTGEKTVISRNRED